MSRFGRFGRRLRTGSAGRRAVSSSARSVRAVRFTALLDEGCKDIPLTPVEAVRAVLPEWAERGDGAFLMTTGHTAVAPRPYMSGVGPLMYAARNWLYSLNGELADIRAYAGTLSIAAFIARSEMGELAASAMPDQVGPLVDPDDLAEHYWDLYTKRDRVEQINPQLAAG